MKCYFLPVDIYSSSSGQGGLSKLLITLLSPWLPTSFYSLPPVSAPHSFCCHVASHSSFQVHICFCNSPPTAFSDPSHVELCSSHPSHPGGGFRACGLVYGTSLRWSLLVQVPSSEPAPGRKKNWRKSPPTQCIPSLQPYPSPSWLSKLKFSPESYLTSCTERKGKRRQKENKETAFSIFLKLQLKKLYSLHSSPVFHGTLICDLLLECFLLEHGVGWKKRREGRVSLPYK